MPVNTSRVRLANWVNFIVALWLIVSPFILQYADVPEATINAIIVGALVAILAAVWIFGVFGGATVGWAIAILGVWQILSPWILGYSGETAAMVNAVIVGAIFVIFGAWSAIVSPRRAL